MFFWMRVHRVDSNEVLSSFNQKGWVSVVNFIIQYPIFVVIKVKDYLVFIYKGLKSISLSYSVNRIFDIIIFLRHLSGAQLSCSFYLR